jgi:hypothetical protein
VQIQLRLAERQGCLVGYHISQLQYYAISILQLLDKLKEIKEQDRQLRLSMLASGQYDVDLLFPEIFAKVETNDDAELPAEVDSHGDPINTKYDFSNAQFDPKKAEEEIAEMMARAASSETSLDDVYYDEWV